MRKLTIIFLKAEVFCGSNYNAKKNGRLFIAMIYVIVTGINVGGRAS